MSGASQQTSLKLWKVLERVGVSERMRKLHRDCSTREEIICTVVNTMTGPEDVSFYIFGSSSEGTTTPDMDSDRDTVNCYNSCPVIEDIEHANHGEALLVVVDTHTRPGYVKLHKILDGTPLTNEHCTTSASAMFDCCGRICLKHISVKDMTTMVSERSGPADTIADEPGHVSRDIVHAYRSETFHQPALESLLECIRSGWLTSNDVETMISFGCLYVGVGHPASPEKDIEWRVSFSFQERYIMFSLNATQHNCYVLLKIIKNLLTSKPDVGKSITSYHCKTCLFRTISTTTVAQWTPENLIECTLMCLNDSRQCLIDGNLPNFFIKMNNMFERRVFGQVQQRLIHYLDELIGLGYKLFYSIKSDFIGEVMKGNDSRYEEIDWKRGQTIYARYIFVLNSLSHFHVAICEELNKRSNTSMTKYIYHQFCYLTCVNTVTCHSQQDTKEMVMCMEQILHKVYAQHLASQALSSEMHNSRHSLLQASAKHLQQGMNYDVLSGKLMFATILYRQGNIEMCCDLLERLARLEPNVDEGLIMSVCGCFHLPRQGGVSLVRRLSEDTAIDIISLMESNSAACTIFLRSQCDITPTSLQYEMYRSVASPPRSADGIYDYWYDMAVVDSKVYLYYLQYLVYSDLNDASAKLLAGGNLCEVLREDPNLGHRETGYNLFGWICSNEGDIAGACLCYLQSWMIRPQHNAAKWYMLILAYRLFVARYRGS